MEYKLKELPKTIHWSEIIEFTIVAEDGTETQIRKQESSQDEGAEYWMLKDSEWVGIDSTDMIVWLGNDYYEAELQLADEYIKNNRP